MTHFPPEWNDIGEISSPQLGTALSIAQHKATGTDVILCDTSLSTPNPMGHVCIVVPTEASSNHGIPHCLEHLSFLGSQQYPRGYLDHVAQLCISSGTNAWTCEDHTAYTFDCVGAQGIKPLLPIFLDHLLFPLLSDNAFLTEVHHITRSGESDGVVFNEMLAREQSEDDVRDSLLRRLLYPHSTLCNEAGGRTPWIRRLTPEAVRSFHARMYNLETMKIILCGPFGGGGKEEEEREDLAASFLNIINEYIVNNAQQLKERKQKNHGAVQEEDSPESIVAEGCWNQVFFHGNHYTASSKGEVDDDDDDHDCSYEDDNDEDHRAGGGGEEENVRGTIEKLEVIQQQQQQRLHVSSRRCVVGHFPGVADSPGSISFAWKVQPSQMNLLEVVGRWLTDNATSPMRSAFTEVNPPLATSVHFEVYMYSAFPSLVMTFSGVSVGPYGCNEKNQRHEDNKKSKSDAAPHHVRVKEAENTKKKAPGIEKKKKGAKTQQVVVSDFDLSAFIQRVGQVLRDALTAPDAAQQIHSFVSKEVDAHLESYDQDPGEYIVNEVIGPWLWLNNNDDDDDGDERKKSSSRQKYFSIDHRKSEDMEQQQQREDNGGGSAPEEKTAATTYGFSFKLDEISNLTLDSVTTQLQRVTATFLENDCFCTVIAPSPNLNSAVDKRKEHDKWMARKRYTRKGLESMALKVQRAAQEGTSFALMEARRGFANPNVVFPSVKEYLRTVAKVQSDVLFVGDDVTRALPPPSSSSSGSSPTATPACNNADAGRAISWIRSATPFARFVHVNITVDLSNNSTFTKSDGTDDENENDEFARYIIPHAIMEITQTRRRDYATLMNDIKEVFVSAVTDHVTGFAEWVLPRSMELCFNFHPSKMDAAVELICDILTSSSMADAAHQEEVQEAETTFPSSSSSSSNSHLLSILQKLHRRVKEALHDADDIIQGVCDLVEFPLSSRNNDSNNFLMCVKHMRYFLPASDDKTRNSTTEKEESAAAAAAAAAAVEKKRREKIEALVLAMNNVMGNKMRKGIRSVRVVADPKNDIMASFCAKFEKQLSAYAKEEEEKNDSSTSATDNGATPIIGWPQQLPEAAIVRQQLRTRPLRAIIGSSSATSTSIEVAVALSDDFISSSLQQQQNSEHSTTTKFRVDVYPPAADSMALPLYLLCEVLQLAEGPLYNAVRGNGLAYGVCLSYSYLRKQVSLRISETAYPEKALVACKSALMIDASKAKSVITEEMLIRGKASLLSGLCHSVSPDGIMYNSLIKTSGVYVDTDTIVSEIGLEDLLPLIPVVARALFPSSSSSSSSPAITSSSLSSLSSPSCQLKNRRFAVFACPSSQVHEIQRGAAKFLGFCNSSNSSNSGAQEGHHHHHHHRHGGQEHGAGAAAQQVQRVEEDGELLLVESVEDWLEL